ncbi:hypothetical protein EV426DRAFT_597079 [Tirmania nivea]|nr:hypothetical protein EV426DRAFT_597079 [Tirmania nivea]
MADASLFIASSPSSFTTPSTSATASTSCNTQKSTPTKPHAAHIRNFFESQPYKSWKFAAFDSHCRTFADYVWSHQKILNFWLKQLNRLLDEKSPLAPTSKIKQLIRDSRLQTSRSSKAKQLDSSQKAPITFIQGSAVGSINISESSITSTSNVGTSEITGLSGSSSKSESVEQPCPLPEAESIAGAEPDDNVFAGTPPAPPPAHPSPVVFQNGASIDVWFSNLRDGPSMTLRYPYLLDSNIVDLDDEPIRQACCPVHLEELQIQLTFALPHIADCVAFAIKRFNGCQAIESYREIAETSPRPAGVAWSRINHPASYINQAVFHLTILMDKLTESMVNIGPYLREGFFDSSVNPWFIDSLFLGGCYPNLVVSRKEIQSYIPGYAEKSDAVFRYVDGVLAFDLGVIEVSGGTTNVNNDPKSGRDHAKVHRALAGNLDILGTLVRKDWDYMQKLQVFGIINSGWNVNILQMIYISPQVKMMKMHRTYRIPISTRQIKAIFPLLSLMTQCQIAMENTVKCILDYQEAHY